jgi:collagen type VII alpha
MVGTAGVTGLIGVNGATGASGVTGVTGVTGPTGASGFAGSPGTAGATGATGGNGLSGNTGPTGLNGTVGVTGVTGSTGPSCIGGTCVASQTTFAGAGVSSSSSGGVLNLQGSGVSGNTIFGVTSNGGSRDVLKLSDQGLLTIGSPSARGQLKMYGQMYADPYDAGGSTTLDFNNGNVQATSATPTTLTLVNMQDGGAYTVIATSTTSGTFLFNASGLTFLFQPANGPTTAGKVTLYSILRYGSSVYVSWVTGF